ncbi:hypothetical protein [Sporosarcina sp. FA9]|uniref:hypothetical protein n=1 Tax=Sporosarcina sp. FA9 TaxID=3413030 RepID=UPI003F65773C
MSEKISDYTHEEKQRALDEAWEEMNDAERLERIKQMQRNGNVIWEMGENGLAWLIEQAERVRELEKLAKHWESCTNSERNIAGKAQNRADRAEKENKRLRDKHEGLVMFSESNIERIVHLMQENEVLEEKLNKIKALVNTGKVGHRVKFELEMMFRDGFK